MPTDRNDQGVRDFGLADQIETFEVFDKKTGEKRVVDERTFNPEFHAKTAPKSAKKEEDDGEGKKGKK